MAGPEFDEIVQPLEGELAERSEDVRLELMTEGAATAQASPSEALGQTTYVG
jgi:hypothetical protein